MKIKLMPKLKILGISTSGRGRDSNTYYLMKAAFDQIKDKDVEKEIIVASELNLRPCEHHYSMNARMCVHPCLITRIDKDDEMVKIYDGILNSDIVIFSTPIYWGNHSHLMQLIIERLNSLENANSVHGQILIKNKVAGIMVLGHEDGYQHIVGGLMNFLTALGMIFPPYAYAAWVGESNEDTVHDRERVEKDEKIKEIFSDLVQNTVDFARQVLFCEKCGRKLDYGRLSNIKRSVD